ncbi:MAG: DUF2750 domain-containing protein [Candidatus Nitronauta litoralis]|uniref:DUF2750 domain-containing protein n=1 Tax=Candidatus Nitronauta litoralis TaxID=2705533 RepID=A0A7T0G0D9_9BACT|nr:MAG: DUF2750 domain-containing protein [Candidatus Nitronauta litoralis]
MSQEMDENQFQTLIKLDPGQRYRFAIQKFIETEEVWSLAEDQLWAVGQDPMGRQFLPIWPHPDLANRCRTNNWTGYHPRVITLKAWQERWISGIHSANKFISVFPVPKAGAVMVSPERMRRDLDAQMNLGNQ